MNVDKMIAKLQKQFPDVWMKDGAEFANGYENTIWTGEGSDIGGAYAFNSYSYDDTMGVHPKFNEALDKLGLYAQFYDAGTVFIYDK